MTIIEDQVINAYFYGKQIFLKAATKIQCIEKKINGDATNGQQWNHKTWENLERELNWVRLN